eukprot:CAMPEP_0194679432 /NCGR_PEP_ID=MMETSP0295-20121207/10783_1 /TAXON_ID=39354 /ORGANISM="Heterosigma akashiwo, Strain CCMP2393" /LENGTH=686 /DNA_ID=CAMNT_0039564823 /DNA_START=54 /DNA_END=2110 /DNA_ORIENTATION=-
MNDSNSSSPPVSPHRRMEQNLNARGRSDSSNSRASHASRSSRPRPGRNRPSPQPAGGGGASNALTRSYELLVHAIIRPPRAAYRPQDLGPQALTLRDGLTMLRRDFQVVNRRGQLLVASRWAPAFAGGRDDVCVLYLHGNSSCRMDVLRSGVLNTVATVGYSLVAFDFAGSGLSDGEYVSLGYYEKDDIDDVTQYIIQRGWATKMCLWGRSMGAASALLYTALETAAVTALVLDSPFASLQEVALDLVEGSRMGIPGFMVKGFLQFLRLSVQKRAGFDIQDLVPARAAPECRCPALFLTATNDKMVFPKHGQQLVRAYGGARQRLEFVGTHNSHRPSLALKAAAIFLRTAVEAPHKIPSAFDTVRQLFGVVTEEYSPAPTPRAGPGPGPGPGLPPRAATPGDQSSEGGGGGGGGGGGATPSSSASPGPHRRSNTSSAGFSVTNFLFGPSDSASEASPMPAPPAPPSSALPPPAAPRLKMDTLKHAQAVGGAALASAAEEFAQAAEDAVLEDLFARGVAICALEQWYRRGPDRVAEKAAHDAEGMLLDELLIMAAAHLECTLAPDPADRQMYQENDDYRQFTLGMKAAEVVSEDQDSIRENFDCKYWTTLDWRALDRPPATAGLPQRRPGHQSPPRRSSACRSPTAALPTSSRGGSRSRSNTPFSRAAAAGGGGGGGGVAGFFFGRR